jgi:hypothetical protein
VAAQITPGSNSLSENERAGATADLILAYFRTVAGGDDSNRVGDQSFPRDHRRTDIDAKSELHGVQNNYAQDHEKSQNFCHILLEKTRSSLLPIVL